MLKLFVLLLFIRSGSPVVPGHSFEIGTYPSLGECQAAADTALYKSDEEPREWKPFIGQWVCIARSPDDKTRMINPVIR
jgi:hypothetical protein